MAKSPGHNATSAYRSSALMRIRLRVVMLGIALVLANAYWIRWIGDTGAGSPWVTLYTLVPNAVAMIFLLTLANALVARAHSEFALRKEELLVLYVMVAIGTSFCSADFMYYLPTMLAYGQWFALRSPRWGELLAQALPGQLVVKDQEAVLGYFTGDASLYRLTNLSAWLTPVFWWVIPLSLVVLVMLCLNRLLLPRWSREERLAFPLTAPPMMLTVESQALFADRLFWLGLTAPLIISLVNLLNRIYPSLPAISLWLDLTPTLGRMFPWSAMYYLGLDFSPFAFGLSFLAPTDLSLSLWLFNVLWRAASVLGAQFGITRGALAGFPYYVEQALGGGIALVVSIAWLGRAYLKRVARQLVAVGSDSQETRAIRWAFAGLAFGGAGLFVLCTRVGLSTWVAVSFLAIFFLAAIATTRLRAQVGPPSAEMVQANVTTSIMGTTGLQPLEMGFFTLVNPLTFSGRATPMGVQMEGMFMLRRVGLGSIHLALLVAGVMGVIAIFWASLDVSYRLGVSSRVIPWAGTVLADYWYGSLTSWLEAPTRGQTVPFEALGVGAAITLALSAAAARWPGWPLHPAGFILSSSSGIHALLPSIFLAWLAKVAIVRYAGRVGYDRAMRVCSGVIVGDALGSMLLACAGMGMRLAQ